MTLQDCTFLRGAALRSVKVKELALNNCGMRYYSIFPPQMTSFMITEALALRCFGPAAKRATPIPALASRPISGLMLNAAKKKV